MNLKIENHSHADDKFLNEFYFEVENLPAKLVELINKKNLKIILADKFSDVIDEQTLDSIKEYKENYNLDNIDKTIRGSCSVDIDGGSIFVFYNTTNGIVGAILYHEIGHIVDHFKDYETSNFSNDIRFVNAYKKDLTLNWKKIKKDNRFRLIHYIQNSTPENLNELAMQETFAHCFARSFNKVDDIDIVEDYFENSLNITKEIVNKFL